MQTLRQSRLSVSKVTKKEWDFILGLVDEEDDGEITAAPSAPLAQMKDSTGEKDDNSAVNGEGVPDQSLVNQSEPEQAIANLGDLLTTGQDSAVATAEQSSNILSTTNGDVANEAIMPRGESDSSFASFEPA